MNAREIFRKLIERTGYSVYKMNPPQYNQDGLRSIHNHEFMSDPSFRKAYERGAQAAHVDYLFHWRVHIGLWAAFSASKLDGDFVECGVNRGFLSSAIMEYLNWNSINKTFYLMDTFAGLDHRYSSEEERARVQITRNEDDFYTTDIGSVKTNFSQWHNVTIIQGPIPDTLESVKAVEVAYLHLDMNSVVPEVSALRFFWDKLVPGAFVLLDDYAYRGYEAQKAGMDGVAKEKGVRIASLPTGQGLLIKPG